MFVRCDWQTFIYTIVSCIFCSQVVVVVIIFDSSKTRKLVVGVEVQSLFVIESCSKRLLKMLHVNFGQLALRFL